MRAVSESVTDLEIFRISLVNRPILVLKCEYGKQILCLFFRFIFRANVSRKILEIIHKNHLR